MSNFSASIVARLDTSKIPGDIKSIEKQRITLSNFVLDTKGLPSKLQASLDNHKFKLNIDGIKIGNIDSQMKKVGASASKSFSQSFSAYKDLMSIQRQLNSANMKFAKLDPSRDVSQVKELNSQIQRLENEYKQLYATSRQELSVTQFKELDSAINIVADKLNVLKAKLQDTAAAKEMSADFDGLYNTAKKISSLKVTLAGLDENSDFNQIAETKRQLESLISTYNSLSVELSEKLSTEQLEKLVAVSKETSDKIAVLNAKSEDGIKYASALDVDTFDNKLTAWLQKNSAAAKQFGGAIEALRNKLHTLNATGQLTDSMLDGLEDELKSIDQQAIKAGKTGSTFTDTFSKAFRSILNYVSVSSVIYGAGNSLKKMYQNVVEIDSAMTELKKVTNETDKVYANFLRNASKSAKEIGSTVTDYISSTSYFARLGYSFGDSQELAKVANIYAVVGDEIKSNEDATKSIISTLTAFNVEASNAISIVDKFNEIGNRFAISSGGIGAALEKSASSLAAANNSLDQSIALITAANTVVQDPEAVGVAFKTKFCLYVQKCA